MEMTTETIVKLIDEVRKRSAIWNKREKLHRDTKHVDNLWMQIAHKLDLDKHEIKTKWRNLRDYYRSIRAKNAMNKCDDSSTLWPYFQQMSFLKDTSVAGRNNRYTSRNSSKETVLSEVVGISPVIIDVDPEEVGNVEVKDVDEILKLSRRYETDGEYHLNPLKKLKFTTDDTSTDVGLRLQFLETQLKLIEGCIGKSIVDDRDADTQFFLSLLPDLKSLNAREKMECKIEIQKLLLRYMVKRN